MFPLRDINPTERFPIITVGLIIAFVAAFIFQLVKGMDMSAFMFGFVPARLSGFMPEGALHARIKEESLPAVVTLISSVFMHGGFLHLLGNMWFLWIFGDNVEDVMGRINYLLFYLAAGAIASLSHFVLNVKSPVPLVGASGAISGVMAAYLLLFPRARVATLIFLGFFIQVVNLPALIVIGLWILFQVIYGFVTVGEQGGGVAYFAHIGGFVAGLLLYRLFIPKKNLARLRINKLLRTGDD